MRMIWNKGHRIRASDKHLVYHFSIGMLLFIFVTVLLLLNMKQLMCTDWEHFSLLENGLTLSPYNFITIGIATGVCALVAFLYYRFCYDSFKKLLHRQKLARMILENKWYEADTVQDSGFFTDLQSRSREKIVWFPKIYYQMEKGLLHIRCEITLGKYQDQLLRLEDKLESGLYCELTDKTLHDGYIEYTLLYDMIANRITIDEVWAENGCLRLMKNLVYMAADDVQPQGYQGQLDKYIDCGTTYDAWNQAVAVVEVVAKLACGEKVPQENYIEGRLATPDTIESMENIWSRDYSD